MLGRRIYQARLIAGLTQKEVVEKLAQVGYVATAAVISKYELDKSTPPPTLLLKLAEVLNVDTTYFLYTPQSSIEWVAYRKHSQLPQNRQEKIQFYAQDVADLQVELMQLFYPNNGSVFKEPTPIYNTDEVELLAQDLRKEWGLGDLPIENLTHIAESKGVVIVRWIDDAGKFDGLSGWCNRTVPVSVVNTSVAIDRRRFNLAHELGHLLMQTEEIHVERLANRFAGAFLVPKEVVYRELGRKRKNLSLDELGNLKKRYGLSIQGWIFRARDLGVISEQVYKNLWQEISQRGWRQSEPVAYNYSADETPTLLEQMCFRAVAEGLITQNRIHQVLPDLNFGEEIVPTSEFPSPTQLLAMSEEERQKWIDLSFEMAKDMDFEIFDAFGEEYF